MLTLVAALSLDGVIGRDGDLPWRLPDDLKRFKRLTMGCPMIMGRRTWDSIGRPLPGRRTLVLSRRPAFEAPGAEVFPDLDAALAAVADAPEVIIAGGETVYARALPAADRLCLTVVHVHVDGDACFPAFDAATWGVKARSDHPADARHAHAHTYFDLRRDAALPRPPLPFPAGVRPGDPAAA